jgi:hypothetical protein
MTQKKPVAGVLPTKSTSPRRASTLTKLVTAKALDHLIAKGAIKKMARGNCCKPDGGTCCPNR